MKLHSLLSCSLTLAGMASSVQLTFYGYPDNAPPGAGTAYNCGGRNFVAGGSGTHDDPLTIATAPGELNQCEVIYVPYLKKYGRVEDSCAQCTDDWKSGKQHIDIWTGSNTVDGGQQQFNCEDALTPNAQQTIIRNPDFNLEVDNAALYDPNTGTCGTSHTYGVRQFSHHFRVLEFDL
ncbi:hypothetical protein A1O3_07394 [Capronia epimyces CBS 606.96]|uniref:Uncharacterized protein n=1 Tax=Capronia epimyces CBS 606.96 TaxID=1182542 RepID=W9XVS0_9EURO|nr:uncharacterized protein A1O3_07394 [Capronia epimyces CBS 606.96]EXJ81106.1 hypothetical protein A1O3_07394 [Capronia epimyces CBS 606.96]